MGTYSNPSTRTLMDHSLTIGGISHVIMAKSHFVFLLLLSAGENEFAKFSYVCCIGSKEIVSKNCIRRAW